MTIHEAMRQALTGLAPTVGRTPLAERPDTYIAWTLIRSAPRTASNRWFRAEHLIQIDLYSKGALDELLTLTLHRLRKAGIQVVDWGPETFETDTRYRHIPIDVRLETREEEE